jgi:hypothetical protein
MSVQYFMLFAGFVLTLVAGVGILLLHNWARILFVAWSVVSLAIGVVTSPVKMLAIQSSPMSRQPQEGAMNGMR